MGRRSALQYGEPILAHPKPKSREPTFRTPHSATATARDRGRDKDINVCRLLPDYSNIKPNTEKGRNIIGRYRTGWLEPYRDNWSILGLPEADGF